MAANSREFAYAATTINASCLPAGTIRLEFRSLRSWEILPINLDREKSIAGFDRRGLKGVKAREI